MTASPIVLTIAPLYSLVIFARKDGVLDRKDEAWLEFHVWHDANSNGVVDESETKTLGEWGITAIKLTSDGQGQDAQGNWIAGYGTYNKGETQFNIFADVGLSVSDIGYKVTQAANGQIVEFKAEDVELGPNPGNGSLRTYRMFQANDLPLSMNLTQEGLTYDIVVGGKGDDALAVENAGADVLKGADGDDILFIDSLDSVAGGQGHDIAFLKPLFGARYVVESKWHKDKARANAQ